MHRRELLKAAGASLATLAAPRIGRAEKASKLVFVPTENLGVLDPVVTQIRSTRNHAYLVFDTLYGIDTSWMAQPQMVEGHQVEGDGLTWTLRLRDGLRFHDKEPVLARDVVASIRRFAARISFAGALMAVTEELSAPDDRTVRFRLKRPFPHLPEALAGPGGIVPAIMPQRLAATSPFKPSTDRPRAPTRTAITGSERTGSRPSTAGRRARVLKRCAPPGSTPATLTSSGGSAPNCRCSSGRTCRTFRWANIGNPPPIGMICSTCCPAASRSSMASAELKKRSNGVPRGMHAAYAAYCG
jgi:peptide/nickel transport system substrate-binding protein